MSIVSSLIDSDPLVPFRVMGRVSALLGSHMAVVSPAERALPKTFLKKPFWGLEHRQAWSHWESCSQLTVYCKAELSLQIDLQMTQS